MVDWLTLITYCHRHATPDLLWLRSNSVENSCLIKNTFVARVTPMADTFAPSDGRIHRKSESRLNKVDWPAFLRLLIFWLEAAGRCQR